MFPISFPKWRKDALPRFSHIELREYIAFALGVKQWEDTNSIEEIVRRSNAKPRFPCSSLPANKEVLENKHPDGQTLTSANLKELNTSNMDVFWRKEIYDYYSNHPDRFTQDHPHLKLVQHDELEKRSHSSSIPLCMLS